MKKCSGCGSEFDDTSRYCPYCGTEYGAEENRTGAAEEYEWQPEKKGRTINTGQGMIWHRVLLLFLIVNAIWSIISGLGYMNRYRNPEWIAYYRTVPGLQVYIVFCGAAQIVIGAYALTVYNRLRKYRKDGPGALKKMYIICIAAILLLQVWKGRILPQSGVIDGVTFLDLLKNILMLVINNVYYAKRRDLFVN